MLKKIKKPNFMVEEVFDKCVSSFKKNEVKEKYNREKKGFINQENNLIESLEEAKPELIKKYKSSLNKAEVNKLYNEKLVKSVPGRSYYNQLMLLPDFQQCPLCNINRATELDHFYPKSSFYLLSITPLNLYACCHECNKNKRELYGNALNNSFVNPYFEDLNSENWLRCEMKIVEGQLIFIYFVNPNSANFERINYIFTTLKLNERYSDKANVSLYNKLPYYKNMFIKCGEDGLNELINNEYFKYEMNIELTNWYKKEMFKEILKQKQAFFEFVKSKTVSSP